ncbi:MAG TPA: FIST N-terminal domain-containing protein [Kofleriaceae bacterium]|nr:FIST N-terminal domain-containing protein [Kofleriaceae bacterium]
MGTSIARQVVATGADTEQVAREIVEGLRAPDLRIAFVFADWRHDPHTFARVTQHGLSPAVSIGGSTSGVIANSAHRDGINAVGLGLYGDWVHVGVGVASDLPKAALTGSRDAVQRAAASMGRSANGLDPSRHVAITLVEGRCGHEEAFCIGSAAAAPQIRFVGGCSSTEVHAPHRRAHVWLGGEVLDDAGVVIILESELPFHAVTSAHLVATETKTVVTAASGRVIEELDGRPALYRLRQITAYLGDDITMPRPSSHSFARYVDGVPYVRSITHFEGNHIHLASAVEAGHVLRVMRPGDLIGTTTRDLAAAAEKVGGTIAALLAFSCAGRHWEAASKNLERELAGAYAQYSAVGLQSLGEQAGMLLVNHTLTGLAIGARR